MDGSFRHSAGKQVRLLLAPLILGCAAFLTQDVQAQCCPGPGYEAGVLIVRFQDGTTLETAESVAASVGAIVERQWIAGYPWYIMGVPFGEERTFIPLFRAFPEVQGADTNGNVCFDPENPCSCCPCGLVCDTIPVSCSACGGAILEGASGTGALTLESDAGGRITLAWGQSCAPGPSDFSVYEGTLGSFYSHVPIACSTSGLTTFSFVPSAGDSYYLVVPRTASYEGSYGADSRRLQIPRLTSACLPQGIATSCF